jgi:hypothetical protein
MKKPNNLIYPLIIMGIYVLYLRGCGKVEEPPEPPKIEQKATYIDYGATRGYDYKTGLYIPLYTDEDIRVMRENNPDKIIKVPGRRILSREQLMDERIEEYMEEHMDEYIDKNQD